MTEHNVADLERTVAWYESFVDSLRSGYKLCVQEYTNDLSSRQMLDDLARTPQWDEIWTRVDGADAELRKILQPTKTCICGEYSKAAFWFWGYPPNSPKLESNLRDMGAI